ncbi:hypothetical protein BGX33_008979 [Mortierella sp. NVP41]|nr:hypothetical protein BGX33_008979 [Mortierella sp. NVP41]
MVLLPAQDELVEIFRKHKKEVQCPKCLQKGRFQRDGFKDGKIRFTCETAVLTTDKSKSARCNKHFAESVMEQLLLQVIAKENRRALQMLDRQPVKECSSSGQAPDNTTTRTATAVTTRSAATTASGTASSKRSIRTISPTMSTPRKRTKAAAASATTPTQATAAGDNSRSMTTTARIATKDFIRQALLSDQHFIRSAMKLAQCSEKAFLQDTGRILREDGDYEFEFVMVKGRFQAWMESHSELTGTSFSQEGEMVYNQAKSGMNQGMFWSQHRCCHSERPSERTIMPWKKQKIDTAQEPDDWDDSDDNEESSGKRKGKESLGGRPVPNKSGCRASIQETLEPYQLPDGEWKPEERVTNSRTPADQNIGQPESTSATQTMTAATKAVRAVMRPAIEPHTGGPMTRSRNQKGFILPPAPTPPTSFQPTSRSFMPPSPFADPSGPSLDDSSDSTGDRLIQESEDLFAGLLGSLLDELQEFTAYWKEALETLENNPTLPNGYRIQDGLLQVLTILREEIGESIHLEKLRKRVVRYGDQKTEEFLNDLLEFNDPLDHDILYAPMWVLERLAEMRKIRDSDNEEGTEDGERTFSDFGTVVGTGAGQEEAMKRDEPELPTNGAGSTGLPASSISTASAKYHLRPRPHLRSYQAARSVRPTTGTKRGAAKKRVGQDTPGKAKSTAAVGKKRARIESDRSDESDEEGVRESKRNKE